MTAHADSMASDGAPVPTGLFKAVLRWVEKALALLEELDIDKQTMAATACTELAVGKLCCQHDLRRPFNICPTTSTLMQLESSNPP